MEKLWKSSGYIFKSHPWHGVSIGDKSPQVVTTYIELVPGDTVKYELDKDTGFLRIDRPQAYSNICPTLYGLIPQTYSGKKVAEYCNQKTNRIDIVGDKDPIDICVLSEKIVPHGDVLVSCRPIGGFRMLDGGEADDKIIAVMSGDAVYGKVNDVSDLEPSIINRLKHYFLTYKQNPDILDRRCLITHIYDRNEAYEVIRLGMEDYHDEFPGMSNLSQSTRVKP